MLFEEMSNFLTAGINLKIALPRRYIVLPSRVSLKWTVLMFLNNGILMLDENNIEYTKRLAEYILT